MVMAVEFRAGYQPLHGHGHSGGQRASVEAAVVGQRDNIDVAGLEAFAHTR
ncbi:hypothetical protein D3C79_1070850 [compost metagenome]